MCSPYLQQLTVQLLLQNKVTIIWTHNSSGTRAAPPLGRYLANRSCPAVPPSASQCWASWCSGMPRAKEAIAKQGANTWAVSDHCSASVTIVVILWHICVTKLWFLWQKLATEGRLHLKTTYFAITLIKEVGKGNHLCFKGLVKAVAGVSQLITTLVAIGSPFVKFLQKLVKLINFFMWNKEWWSLFNYASSTTLNSRRSVGGLA